MGYWEERQKDMFLAGEMTVNQYYSKLERAFNQTKRELQKTIEEFYFRYAKENGLSYTEAQRKLDKEELGELAEFIRISMQNIGKYNQTVNNMSIKARITRYQALEAQVDAILRQLYAIDYQAEAEKMMQEVYEESYYRTWYNIDQYHGFHSAFAQVGPRTVQTLLEYPFNGAKFSNRLWKQKDHLQGQLMEAVTTMLIQGKHPRTLAADFAKKMQSKKFDAYRLLHTESSFLISEATHAGYREDGVEKYQILATLDSKTCGVCGDLDKKVYEVGKEVVGINMPPFHPLCRCTDAPYREGMDYSKLTRTARDADAKYIDVPGTMTYNEWKKKYLPSKERQNATDKVQYLVRKHKGASDIVNEKKIVDEAIAEIPKKVQAKLEEGTVVDIGQIGASQYDYTNDILYVAKGAEKQDVIHEIGHLVESKMLNPGRVQVLKKQILETIGPLDFVNETYYNANGDPVEIFLIKSDRFVSEYQGRVYIDDWSELLDDDMRIRPEIVAEFISEPFREYVENTERLKRDFPEFYELIREAVE